MIRHLFFFLLLAGSATAQPRVVTDIPPVHMLVDRIMGDLAEPVVILPPGSDPHHYSLRPTQAAALQKADVVFWIGHELTPWLEDPLATLSPDARRISLLEAAPVVLALSEDGHSHGEDSHGGASHDAIDPHAWLAPANMQNWAALVSQTLTDTDPANAATYQRNADAYIAELAANAVAIEKFAGTWRGDGIFVYHDAYGYLLHHLDLQMHGALSDTDASPPSPAHLAQMRHHAAEIGKPCIIAGPGFNMGLVEAVFDNRATVIPLDPLSASPADHLRAANEISACLSDQ